MAKYHDRLSDFFHIGGGVGNPHATSQYTLSGFGASGTVTLTNCNDVRGRVRINPAGGSYSANATVAVAYSTVYDTAPHVYVCRGGGSQATIIMSTTAESTTGFTAMFNGTCTGGETYTFNYLTMA